MAAIIPCLNGGVNLIRLVDSIDGRLVVPEMFDGYIATDAAKFTLEANPAGIVGARGCGIEGGATLWIGVMMIVLGYVS